MQYLTTIIFPHYQTLVNDEQNKEVMEKMLMCLKDLAEEMGPASLEQNVDLVVSSLELFLEKATFC
jgi:hypothetical protein